MASMVRANLVSQVLLVSHVNQSDQASFSPLFLSFCLSHPPEGIPGSNRDWTPGHFILSKVSFAVQKLLSLNRNHLFIFPFVSLPQKTDSKNSATVYIKECSV